MKKIAGSTVATFRDIEVLRFEAKIFDKLPIREKIYTYYLIKAAEAGRNMVYLQNGAENLTIKVALETILQYHPNPQEEDEWRQFEEYLYNFWFSAGLHHHYNNYKLEVGFSRDFFTRSIQKVRDHLPFVDIDATIQRIEEILFTPSIYPYKYLSNSQGDSLATSSVNFYDSGITQQEVEAFYQKQEETWRKEHPEETIMPSFGLNSRIRKEGSCGPLVEDVYFAEGLYSEAILAVCHFLFEARRYAPTPQAEQYLSTLIKYYETGDLTLFDQFNIEWVQDSDASIDFINGFIETYSDPLGRKAMWESCVYLKNEESNHRAQILSQNAQWFEDHAPIDPCFRKSQVIGVSARVVEMMLIGGDNFPSTAIGINLPNSNDIRKAYGSKSITIDNITQAYDHSEGARRVFEAFVFDDETRVREEMYGSITNTLHTDLHECLGHGSGQLKKGVSPDALGAYSSTIEEARADLFALYYIADHKMVELGLLPNEQAYKAEYYHYLLNGLLIQWARIPLGKSNEEAHMQNRALIARYLLDESREDGAVQLDGLTLRINDYKRLRERIGFLLREIQRIKSEGDIQQAEALISRYALSIDAELHKAIIERYETCKVKPYKGFINPYFRPVYRADGTIEDILVDYSEGYSEQMLRLSQTYDYLSHSDVVKQQIQEIRKAMPTRMNGETSHVMRQYGSPYFINWGISQEHVQEIALRYSPSLALACELYQSSVRELKLIALYLFPKEHLSYYYIDRWARMAPSVEIVEAIGFVLLRGESIAIQWAMDRLTNTVDLQENSYLLALHILLRAMKEGLALDAIWWNDFLHRTMIHQRSEFAITTLRVVEDLILRSAHFDMLIPVTECLIHDDRYRAFVDEDLQEAWQWERSV